METSKPVRGVGGGMGAEYKLQKPTANGYAPPEVLKIFSKINTNFEEFLKSFKDHDSSRDR